MIFKSKKSVIPAENKELINYINKIFEQQEKEKLLRWLVNSIRETLDLDIVLQRTVEEVGRLLNVDRCLIALFKKEDNTFSFKIEYKKDENIASALNIFGQKLPNLWHNSLVRDFTPVIANECNLDDIKSLIIVPILDKNEILGILVVNQVDHKREWATIHIEILQDIAGQVAIAIKQAMLYTKVQETTKFKSEFLCGMSHELRTPLNAIIGFAEMLLDENYGKINEKQKKFIKNISVSGEHLLRLVNDILDLSKIEADRMEINYEVFNIAQAVREAVSVLDGLADKKRITITMDVDEHFFINADLRRFKQVMYNLLSNALKFTEENGKVDIKAMELQNRLLKLEVRDTGIGIAPQDKHKIFNSFRQVDSSITRKQEGTGLGLTLTKKLVELHKGTVNFESEEGKGSNFWFTLPGVFSQKLL